MMDLALARRRVEGARVARLGTATVGGRPHLVPCCFALLDDVAYSAVDAKPKSTLALRRIENIIANPAACLLVDYYGEDWTELWWVRLDGIGRVVESRSEDDRAKRALRSKYSQYDELSIPGPVIALGITRWTAWP
ncbi:MAG: TIGR03668 family PPOX class F420-dependent oxidoreductase [Acidimicrobiales bacterium]